MSSISKGKERQSETEIASQHVENNTDSQQSSADEDQETSPAGFLRRSHGDIWRDSRGTLHWRCSSKDKWMRAIYHVDIRDELIAQARRLGQYKYPRERGEDPSDVTSYLPEHRCYGAGRAHRPDILFQYKITEQQMSEYIAPIWMHEGQVVLDQDNHPVLDWPGVPATFSSRIEGWFQEFISRQHYHFTLKDFMARIMPGTTTQGAICMRRVRFRLRTGCLSWRPKRGDAEIEAFLDALYPAEYQIANCTKGFRDLTTAEMNDMQEAGRCIRPKRSKNEALQPRRTRYGQPQTRMNVQAADEENERKMDTATSPGTNQGLARAELAHPHGHTTAPEPNASANNRIDRTDYRHVYPRSELDQRAIVQALEPSRRQFWDLTGQNPEPTYLWFDYATQWGALQMEFDDFWLARGSVSPILGLVMAEEWLGGFGTAPVGQVHADERTFTGFHTAREYYVAYLVQDFQELK